MDFSNLRASIVANAMAHQANPIWTDLLSKYVAHDIRMQQDEQRFKCDMHIAETIKLVTERLCQGDIFGQLLKSGIPDKIVTSILEHQFGAGKTNAPEDTKETCTPSSSSTLSSSTLSSSTLSSSTLSSSTLSSSTLSSSMDTTGLNAMLKQNAKIAWSSKLEDDELVIYLQQGYQFVPPPDTWNVENAKSVRIKIVE